MDGCRAAAPRASQSGGWRADNSELGVFTAERYFHGALAADDALWCDRSSSSLSFSSVFKTGHREGSAPTPTAATRSSEASWSSRSALLPMPNRPVVAAAPAVEAKLNSRTGSEQTGRKHPSSSSSHLRRWLLGVAGCAWACGDGDDPVSADLCRDEVEAGSVHGAKKRSTEADEMLPRRTSSRGGRLHGERHAWQACRRWRRRRVPCRNGNATSPAARGTCSPPSLHLRRPTTNALFDEPPRKSLDMFRDFRPAGQGGTLVVPAKQNSAFTVITGSTLRGGAASAAGGGRGSPFTPHSACGSRRDSGSGADNAAPSELECTYPPSEASVVWSVVTAEGTASGNFSSAASGYCDGDEESFWHTGAGTKSNRPRSSRSRMNGSGLLMGCISKRAVGEQPKLDASAVGIFGCGLSCVGFFRCGLGCLYGIVAA